MKTNSIAVECVLELVEEWEDSSVYDSILAFASELLDVSEDRLLEMLQEEKSSLDEKIAIANKQKGEISFAGYPSLEKIKSDYKELMEMIKGVRTVEAAKAFSENSSIEVEINGVSIDRFLLDGGTDQNIEWIRYEEFGCLSYVYDRFDGKPMFDVSVDDDFYEFITDIRIDDLTEENYKKWVNEDRKSSITKDDELEM